MTQEERAQKQAEYQEIDDRIAGLTMSRTGFERNRTLITAVAALLGYYIYTGVRDGDATWWFFALMGVMILVAVGLFIHVCRQMNATAGEIKDLEERRAALAREFEEADDDEEDDAAPAEDDTGSADVASAPAEDAAPADGPVSES